MVLPLPPEIYDNIFCFLTPREKLVAEGVCRDWKQRISYDGITEFDLTSCQAKNGEILQLAPGLLALLDRLGSKLRKISFGRANLLVSPSVLSVVDRKCPNVTNVDLSYCRLTENIINSLIVMAPRLEVLNLDNSTMTVRKVSQHIENMFILFESLEKVESINLQKTTIHNFPAIPLLPAHLISVNFNNCSPIRPDLLQEFIEKCYCLEELRLSTYSNYTASLFTAICSTQTLRILEMSHVAFSDISSNHGAGWMDLTPLCQLEALEELYLQYNNALDDYSFRFICAQCNEIRVLNVAYCRNLTNYAPLQWLESLEQLTVGGADKFNDAILRMVARFQGGKLKKFFASNCNFGDAGVEELAVNCRNLTDVALTHCGVITDYSVARLFAECFSLVQVQLQGADLSNRFISMTDASTLLHLRVLDVSFCRQIDSVGINDLCKKFDETVQVYGRWSKRDVKIFVQGTKFLKSELQPSEFCDVIIQW